MDLGTILDALHEPGFGGWGLRVIRYTFIDYDNHALTALAERRITTDQVLETLEQPDVEYESTDPSGRIIAERMGRTKALRVVYERLFDDRGLGAYVITVHRLAPRRMKGDHL